MAGYFSMKTVFCGSQEPSIMARMMGGGSIMMNQDNLLMKGCFDKVNKLALGTSTTRMVKRRNGKILIRGPL